MTPPISPGAIPAPARILDHELRRNQTRPAFPSSSGSALQRHHPVGRRHHPWRPRCLPRQGVLLTAPPGGGKTTAFSTLPENWHLKSDDAALVWPEANGSFLICPLPTWSVLLGANPRLEQIVQWQVGNSWPLRGFSSSKSPMRSNFHQLDRSTQSSLSTGPSPNTRLLFWVGPLTMVLSSRLRPGLLAACRPGRCSCRARVISGQSSKRS